MGKLTLRLTRQRHASELDVPSFGAADCDMNNYMVVAEIRKEIAVNKQGSHKFHVERFNFKRLNEVLVKEKYHVEVSNRITALEDLKAEDEINTVLETIRENIKISAKDS
jgi:hypothetical protein